MLINLSENISLKNQILMTSLHPTKGCYAEEHNAEITNLYEKTLYLHQIQI